MMDDLDPCRVGPSASVRHLFVLPFLKTSQTRDSRLQCSKPPFASGILRHPRVSHVDCFLVVEPPLGGSPTHLASPHGLQPSRCRLAHCFVAARRCLVLDGRHVRPLEDWRFARLGPHHPISIEIHREEALHLLHEARERRLGLRLRACARSVLARARAPLGTSTPHLGRRWRLEFVFEITNGRRRRPLCSRPPRKLLLQELSLLATDESCRARGQQASAPLVERWATGSDDAIERRLL